MSNIAVRDLVNGTALIRSSTPVPITGAQEEQLPNHVVCAAPTEDRVYGNGSATGTGDTSLIAASGDASLRTHVCAVQVSNSGTVDTLVAIKNGSGGSTLANIFVPKAADGGFSCVTYPIPLKTSPNVAVYFASGASSTTVSVSAQGYTAP